MATVALCALTGGKVSFNCNVFSKRLCLQGSLFKSCRLVSTMFKASDMQIELSKQPKEKPDATKLVFGKSFSDHMLTIQWSLEKGWEKPQIKPFQNLSIHPACSALHYSVELFEGLKAYRCVDKKIRMFRPMLNMERFHRGALRACLPPSLGVTRSNYAMIFVIIGPVGPYFATGSFNPVSLLADPRFVRSWKGGVGDNKMGGNYGPTIYVQNEAARDGCQQVLWLYGDNHEVTEVGTMNLFVFWKDKNGEEELVTPPLDGLILPGVTRHSLLDLARKWGEFKVSERKITMGELMTALKENQILEVFGSGTACVVCPVSRILYHGQNHHIPTMENGPKLAKRFLKELTDIQYGRTPSDWMHLVV
ncbi:branched-chain-amino-acid aminotransferase, cytosolic-like isoform X4 [Protopterus annectens]|uniref:branched-chain-amino-acid aminotransferase, cytosolic-like isoform X4 n=1 Tax=Protopterus annectens TaxID=7888 RepID=UPI001CFA8072|nr:branched-chain-amino-acid aminotransferase, cytosolic-like isoform X4 [Protopterus annectens]